MLDKKRLNDLLTFKRGLIELAIEDRLPLDLTLLDVEECFLIGALAECEDVKNARSY